ncbi:MAG: sigma-54-dependent Fis family transcriptional regulator [Gemmatimonadetes bacterium]|nr:sigma-54-dependent Fis family transcriptional regulator [Gemmatimonadota bacterium]
MDSARILVIDDEAAMLENCDRLLSREGYACTTLADPSRFRSVAASLQPDLILTDLRMPGVDGMTILAAAVADDPTRPVIVMTAFATVASAVAAVREGAFDYITKPFTADQLLVAIDRAVRYRGLSVENRSLRQQVARTSGGDGILGVSAVLTRLLEQAAQVAPTDANVLITGESGTGKELVARLIHTRSLRHDRPFITVDCAAMPEGLLESELFGHERGAFTGAVQRTEGLLSKANGGTVFLDEIGELSTALQVKLLRVLEQRQMRRVGDSRLIDLDIRVVAATNRDLEASVASGSFRQDLYYRLNVVHFHLPPLRAREGDIPLLMNASLHEFATTARRRAPEVTPEAWAILERHTWPGNVRELRNTAQRLVVLDTDGRITPEDLGGALRRCVDEAPDVVAAARPVAYAEALEEALNEFRRAYVTRLLETHGGNVSRAAATAGVSRRTLHRWLAALHEPVATEWN